MGVVHKRFGLGTPPSLTLPRVEPKARLRRDGGGHTVVPLNSRQSTLCCYPIQANEFQSYCKRLLKTDNKLFPRCLPAIDTGHVFNPSNPPRPVLFHERRVWANSQRATHFGLTWPVPRTRYLKLVSCSTPTGPRACILPVAIPISAPKPNSPPSANCVEALTSTMALSTALVK